MNEQLAMTLMAEIQAIKAAMVTWRQGLVTATSPNIQVQLGGATTSYTNVTSGMPVTVGDVVGCLIIGGGHDIVIDQVLSAANGAAAPVGMVSGYIGGSDPAGGAWLIADGRSLLRASYPEAFTLWGTAFGSVDGTHFNMPDYEDCVLVGSGGVIALNASGGSNTSTALLSHTHSDPAHTHTTPNHQHAISAKWTTNTSHEHTGGNLAEAPDPASGNSTPKPQTDSGGNGTTTSNSGGNTGSAGSGSSFSIMQKHRGANFIVRVLP